VSEQRKRQDRPIPADRHPNDATRAKARALPVTHTPWAPPSADGRVYTMQSSGPADQQARGPADFMRKPPDSDRLTHAVDLAPQLAALGHELAVATETDGDEARELARRFAVSLSPETRFVLLNALAEADAVHKTGHAIAFGTGRELSSSAPSGAPELTRAVPSSGLSILPTDQEPGPGRPGRRPESGDPEFRPAPRNDPPAGLIRLRFADALALERANAAFGAASGAGFGDAWSDPATLTLRIHDDASVETLRAVLAVLDAAAITAESLTVHTHELDDVFAAFTSLP
jgi:hypothetical protein